MARLTDEQKELILADYHTGEYSQHKLAQKHKVSSRTINTIVKGLEPKHKEKVNAISSYRAELSKESKHEVNAVNDAIDKRTKHLIFFENSALKNQTLANKKLDDKMSIGDLESHSRTTQRNKETVLGKDKVAEINNTNAQQNNTPTQINIVRDD